MNDAKYIGMDVHQATISAAVRGIRTPRRSYLDQGGTTPLLRAYAIDCPRCSC
jgi:hypothetical protein